MIQSFPEVNRARPRLGPQAICSFSMMVRLVVESSWSWSGKRPTKATKGPMVFWCWIILEIIPWIILEIYHRSYFILDMYVLLYHIYTQYTHYTHIFCDAGPTVQHIIWRLFFPAQIHGATDVWNAWSTTTAAPWFSLEASLPQSPPSSQSPARMFCQKHRTIWLIMIDYDSSRWFIKMIWFDHD